MIKHGRARFRKLEEDLGPASGTETPRPTQNGRGLDSSVSKGCVREHGFPFKLDSIHFGHVRHQGGPASDYCGWRELLGLRYRD
jgi:hypothetical protein